VVVGTHAGTVVRYNDPAEAGLLRYGKSTAQAEPALPHADPEAELTRAIRGPAHPDAPRRAAEREYYEVHRAPILCLGFVNVDSLELATLDADGVLAKWPCKGEPLSGRLWHRPSRVAQLDFTIHDRMEASTGAVDRRRVEGREGRRACLFFDPPARAPPRAPLPRSPPPLPPPRVLFDMAAVSRAAVQKRALRKAFFQADADGSGALSPDEVRTVLNKFDIHMEEGEFREMVKRLDVDGDGEVSYVKEGAAAAAASTPPAYGYPTSCFPASYARPAAASTPTTSRPTPPTTNQLTPRLSGTTSWPTSSTTSSTRRPPCGGRSRKSTRTGPGLWTARSSRPSCGTCRSR